MSTSLQYQLLGVALAGETDFQFSDFVGVGAEELAVFGKQSENYQVHSDRLKVAGVLCFAATKGILVTCHAGRRLWGWDEKMEGVEMRFGSQGRGTVREMLFVGQDGLLLMDDSEV